LLLLPGARIAKGYGVPFQPFARFRFLDGLLLRGWIGFVAATIAFTMPRLAAADSQPVFGPGATKEEIINAYGWPSGQSQAGTKEILTYPQGRITLENGRVEKMDFLPNVPWPAPRPRPAAPSPTSVRKAEALPDFWLLNFEDAQKEAARRHARILALFIGSDWSPPSRQFQEEVAFSPEFVNAFTGDFVFLRLDFPTRTPQPQALRDQNAQLRGKYGVTTYPALIVLSPSGTMVAQIDLTKPQAGDSYRARVIAAVREVRDLLIAQPPPPEPGAAEATSATEAKPQIAQDTGVMASLTSAFSLVMGAIVLGLALAGVAWWLLWRKGQPNAADPRGSSVAERISDAASGLPAPNEIANWSREKLVAVITGLAELDDHLVSPRGGGGDGDLTLTRKGDDKPSIIVFCQPGDAGSASVKRVRELFGTITIENVERGWFVAPMGFSHEAKEFARERQIVLIDAEDMLSQMRAAPPILLQKIVARVG
jgi:hypothetical protein